MSKFIPAKFFLYIDLHWVSKPGPHHHCHFLPGFLALPSLLTIILEVTFTSCATLKGIFLNANNIQKDRESMTLRCFRPNPPTQIVSPFTKMMSLSRLKKLPHQAISAVTFYPCRTLTYVVLQYNKWYTVTHCQLISRRYIFCHMHIGNIVVGILFAQSI